jgi:hypothetical protein
MQELARVHLIRGKLLSEQELQALAKVYEEVCFT